jgi:hypothetical protein
VTSGFKKVGPGVRLKLLANAEPNSLGSLGTPPVTEDVLGLKCMYFM